MYPLIVEQNTDLCLYSHAGEPQTFQLSVRPQQNYPLDFYILMDLSSSLGDDLQTIQGIAPDIGEWSCSLISNDRNSEYIVMLIFKLSPGKLLSI